MQGYIKKILGSGHNHPSTTTLITSNNEIEDIIKIAKSLKDSSLLLRGVTETVQNEVKEQKGGFLSMLLGTLGASLLGNPLTGKEAMATSQGWGIYRAGKDKGKGAMTTSQGREIDRAGERVLRTGYGSLSSSALDNNKMDF